MPDVLKVNTPVAAIVPKLVPELAYGVVPNVTVPEPVTSLPFSNANIDCDPPPPPLIKEE